MTVGETDNTHATREHLSFDTQVVPFSARRSWLSISPITGTRITAENLHLVAHTRQMTAVLEFQPLDAEGTPVTTAVHAGPSRLEWAGTDGRIEAVFASPDTVRLRGHGLGLRLRDGAATSAVAGSHVVRDAVDGSIVFCSNDTGLRYRVSGVAGPAPTRSPVDGHAEIVVSGAAWEIAIEEFGSARQPYQQQPDADTSFDDLVRRVADDFDAYVDAVVPWRSAETPAAELAAYILWSATVSPRGFLGRESVLMSKHWMDSVWSWDHCFNALALAIGQPATAFDQFAVMFDHQDESGALPDAIGNSLKNYAYVKPPVHGWAFGRLRELLPPMPPEQLRWAYDGLARLTDIWLTDRRVPGHRLPHYFHGNDSGWDNSTLFDRSDVIETPDLAAFLVLQLDVLAELADELGDPRAAQWRAARAELAAALVEQLWTGTDFVALDAETGESISARSMLRLMPVVAGTELDPTILTTIVESLRGHLTEHGLATEPPDSPHYEPDGYWRGPIWAPSTVLIENGLRRSGHTELADEVSVRFRRMCERSGFAENFDALTGDGLRDRAFTWTASSYILLAREHVGRAGNQPDVPTVWPTCTPRRYCE